MADTFPGILTCSWTSVGAGGGTCTAGPTAGNINDAVTLPAGGSVTYTARVQHLGGGHRQRCRTPRR